MPEDENADALVRRNFAFIDLCGFTSLTDEHGVGEAVAALSTFRAVVRERAGWRGVRVAKWLGDGAMLVATEPRPLLDAVLRMEQALDGRGCPLPLRGGVAAGRVILFEGDDYIGRPVNMAARLCEAAGPGEMLCYGLDEDIPEWIDRSGTVTVRAMGIGDIAGVAQLRVDDDAWAIHPVATHHPSVMSGTAE